MNEEQLTLYTSKFIDFAIAVVPKMLGAVLIVVVGFWVIKKVAIVLRKSLEAAKFGEEIIPFFTSFALVGLKALVLLIAAGIVGIQTASIVGVLAAAGFAVGLALQGSLGNFAAGIIVMVFRPYKVGDLVEVHGKFGKVEEILIFNTMLSTPGLKTLIIPNGKVIEDTITNFSTKGAVRLDLKISIPYQENFPKVKEIIEETLKSIHYVLDKPVPEVGIELFDTHVVRLAVRPFVLPEFYWEAIFEVHRQLKAAFNQHNIKIAYPDGMELGTVGE